MRKREDIANDSKKSDSGLLLEVLLDIRDLLSKKDKGVFDFIGGSKDA